MNLRFPEVFGLLLFVALLCSFALPRSVSGRIENSFQFVFAPVTGPIQWMTGGKAVARRADVPILPQESDEVARLKAEKLALANYVETLQGQLQTLATRAKEAERIGVELSGITTLVKVIGADATGRDILRLAGTSAGAVEKDQAVVASSGLVGRVLEVGLGNQSSVRLITDRGFKCVATFGRYEQTAEGGVRFRVLELDPTLIEGAGNGALRIDSLKTIAVNRAGLREGDIVSLADPAGADWPIEVHGYRIGTVKKVGEKLDTPGVADVVVQPDVELLKLKEVWILTRKSS